MRFLIDMPLSPELAAWLVANGHDAVHASAAGFDQAADDVIMEHARTEQRRVVTTDLDYPRLLALSGAAAPGLILFRGGKFSERESVDRLRRTLEAIPQEELPHSIVVIEKGRIRRRRLPLEPGL